MAPCWPLFSPDYSSTTVRRRTNQYLFLPHALLCALLLNYLNYFSLLFVASSSSTPPSPDDTPASPSGSPAGQRWSGENLDTVHHQSEAHHVERHGANVQAQPTSTLLENPEAATWDTPELVYKEVATWLRKFEGGSDLPQKVSPPGPQPTSSGTLKHGRPTKRYSYTRRGGTRTEDKKSAPVRFPPMRGPADIKAVSLPGPATPTADVTADFQSDVDQGKVSDSSESLVVSTRRASVLRFTAARGEVSQETSGPEDLTTLPAVEVSVETVPIEPAADVSSLLARNTGLQSTSQISAGSTEEETSLHTSSSSTKGKAAPVSARVVGRTSAGEDGTYDPPSGVSRALFQADRKGLRLLRQRKSADRDLEDTSRFPSFPGTPRSQLKREGLRERQGSESKEDAEDGGAAGGTKVAAVRPDTLASSSASSATISGSLKTGTAGATSPPVVVPFSGRAVMRLDGRIEGRPAAGSLVFGNDEQSELVSSRSPTNAVRSAFPSSAVARAWPDPTSSSASCPHSSSPREQQVPRSGRRPLRRGKLVNLNAYDPKYGYKAALSRPAAVVSSSESSAAIFRKAQVPETLKRRVPQWKRVPQEEEESSEKTPYSAVDTVVSEASPAAGAFPALASTPRGPAMAARQQGQNTTLQHGDLRKLREPKGLKSITPNPRELRRPEGQQERSAKSRQTQDEGQQQQQQQQEQERAKAHVQQRGRDADQRLLLVRELAECTRWILSHVPREEEQRDPRRGEAGEQAHEAGAVRLSPNDPYVGSLPWSSGDDGFRSSHDIWSPHHDQTDGSSSQPGPDVCARFVYHGHLATPAAAAARSGTFPSFAFPMESHYSDELRQQVPYGTPSVQGPLSLDHSQLSTFVSGTGDRRTISRRRRPPRMRRPHRQPAGGHSSHLNSSVPLPGSHGRLLTPVVSPSHSYTGTASPTSPLFTASMAAPTPPSLGHGSAPVILPPASVRAPVPDITPTVPFTFPAADPLALDPMPLHRLALLGNSYLVSHVPTPTSGRSYRAKRHHPRTGPKPRRLDSYIGDLPSVIGAPAAAAVSPAMAIAAISEASGGRAVPDSPRRETEANIRTTAAAAAACRRKEERIGEADAEETARMTTKQEGVVCRRLNGDSDKSHQSRGAGLHAKSVSDVRKHPIDVLGMLFIAVASAIAVAAGAGGGAIYVPILILLMEFTPYEAVATSQALIFGGSLAGTILNFFRRNPCSLNQPVIDMEMVVLMGPMQIAGASVGVVVNRCLPTYIILGLLVLLILFMFYKTLLQARRLRRESKKLTIEEGVLTFQEDELPPGATQDQTKHLEEDTEREHNEEKEEEREARTSREDGNDHKLRLVWELQEPAAKTQQQETEEGTESESEDEKDSREEQQRRHRAVDVKPERPVCLKEQLKAKHFHQRAEELTWTQALQRRKGASEEVSKEDRRETEENERVMQQELFSRHLQGQRHTNDNLPEHLEERKPDRSSSTLKTTGRQRGNAEDAEAKTCATGGPRPDVTSSFKGDTFAAEENRSPAAAGQQQALEHVEMLLRWSSCLRCSVNEGLLSTRAHVFQSEKGGIAQQATRKHLHGGLLSAFGRRSVTTDREGEKEHRRLFMTDAVAATTPEAYITSFSWSETEKGLPGTTDLYNSAEEAPQTCEVENCEEKMAGGEEAALNADAAAALTLPHGDDNISPSVCVRSTCRSTPAAFQQRAKGNLVDCQEQHTSVSSGKHRTEEERHKKDKAARRCVAMLNFLATRAKGHSAKKWGLLLLIYVTNLVVTFLKGGPRPSPLQVVTYCSGAYWALYAAGLVFLAGCSFAIGLIFSKRQSRRDAAARASAAAAPTAGPSLSSTPAVASAAGAPSSPACPSAAVARGGAADLSAGSAAVSSSSVASAAACGSAFSVSSATGQSPVARTDGALSCGSQGQEEGIMKEANQTAAAFITEQQQQAPPDSGRGRVPRKNSKQQQIVLTYTYLTMHRLLLQSLVAGFMAGLVGIGGGLLLGPVLLAKGVHPSVSAAVNTALILFTSSSAAVLSISSSAAPLDYSILLFGICFASTLSGKAIVDTLVKKYHASYILVILLLVIMVCSVCFSVASGVINLIKRDPRDFKFKLPCD